MISTKILKCFWLRLEELHSEFKSTEEVKKTVITLF